MSFIEKNLIILGCLVWIVICLACLWPVSTSIEQKFTTEYKQGLAQAGLGEFDFKIAGQVIRLSPTKEALEAAHITYKDDLDQAMMKAKTVAASLTGGLYEQGGRFGVLSGPVTKIYADEGQINALKATLGSAPTAQMIAKAEACSKKVAKTVEKNKLTFQTGSAKLETASEESLSRIAKAILDCSEGFNVHIKGHTDDQGGLDHNLKLSQDRARIAADGLMKRGINGERLRIQGFGATVPLKPNISDENRALNRRVEFIVEAG